MNNPRTVQDKDGGECRAVKTMQLFPLVLMYYNTWMLAFKTLHLTHTLDHTVSFSKVVLSQGAVNKVFLGVFLMFLAFFHSKIWAQFHFGTFKPYKQQKSLKI